MNEDEDFGAFDMQDDTQIRFDDKKYKTEDVLLGPATVLTKFDDVKLLRSVKTDTTISTRDRNLKVLLLQYIRKYKRNPRQYYEHPKQIKNIPSWFEHALATFTEAEIAKPIKDGIRDYFKALIAYRDSRVGSPDAEEMEMLGEQYGEASPYNDAYNPDYKFDNQDAVESVDVNKHARELTEYVEVPQSQQIERSIMSANQPSTFPGDQQVQPMPAGQPQPMQYESQQPPMDIGNYIYGGAKKSAVSSKIGGLDNIILNRRKPQPVPATPQPLLSTPQVVAGPTTARKTKNPKKVSKRTGKSAKRKNSEQKGRAKTGLIVANRVTAPKIETPIVHRKSPVSFSLKAVRTAPSIQLHNHAPEKATDDIMRRIKSVKERNAMHNFADVGISGVSIGKSLVNTGIKTSKKTVAANDTKKFMRENFHFGKETFKIDKSKFKVDVNANMKGEGVDEIKMLRNLVKTPMLSNMKVELKNAMKSNKNTINPPIITRMEYNFTIGKKKNRKQVPVEIEDFDFEN